MVCLHIQSGYGSLGKNLEAKVKIFKEATLGKTYFNNCKLSEADTVNPKYATIYF